MSQSPCTSQSEQASKQALLLRQKKRSRITGLRSASFLLIDLFTSQSLLQLVPGLIVARPPTMWAVHTTTRSVRRLKYVFFPPPAPKTQHFILPTHPARLPRLPVDVGGRVGVGGKVCPVIPFVHGYVPIRKHKPYFIGS